jgi:Fe-S cluster assembly protein SufD
LRPLLFGEIDCCNLVFVNGIFSEHLSSIRDLPKGVKVGRLASALQQERELMERHLARIAGWQENSLSALNTAFMEDGAFIFVPANTIVNEVIHLIFLSAADEEPTVCHPRNLVIVGDNSQLSLVESYFGMAGHTYFTNSVTEVFAGNNSIVDHYKLQRESEEAFHVGTLQVSLRSQSNISSHSISLGGRLVRNNVGTSLEGEGGGCTLNGLYVARNRQHMDNHTTIDHAKPQCSSWQFYKGVMDDNSRGVFNGKILVRPDAQKTNAKQSNKNLLLTEDALVDTKPQLEIFADDVKCTHGATIGKLDEEALFYARSRGIDENSARTLLTYAFASDILRTIRIKPIQCQIDLVLLNRLARGGKQSL